MSNKDARDKNKRIIITKNRPLPIVVWRSDWNVYLFVRYLILLN